MASLEATLSSDGVRGDPAWLVRTDPSCFTTSFQATKPFFMWVYL